MQTRQLAYFSLANVYCIDKGRNPQQLLWLGMLVRPLLQILPVVAATDYFLYIKILAWLQAPIAAVMAKHAC